MSENFSSERKSINNESTGTKWKEMLREKMEKVDIGRSKKGFKHLNNGDEFDEDIESGDESLGTDNEAANDEKSHVEVKDTKKAIDEVTPIDEENKKPEPTLGIVIGIVCVMFSSFFAASVIFPFAPFMAHSFYPNKTDEELGYFVGY
ncbi:hypothetical protein RFI_26134 [Reticulomyxa filosa]|uniref:Uncharacterized protein n=1 Tax=Reticulomyxa filosa TaxID=46433 RepID=X6MC45_RETFI|nr:hypothetical protein RFI_26134 [Reticulomyxa filosa]|eukprot:ETO11241.1 hypothetical protein RFI_26134 [Reticulomyxa filosa]